MNYQYLVDHIPKETKYNRRPGLKMEPTTITIHNTGNPNSTAQNERGWLTNPRNQRQASYHIVVDENKAIECLPLNEVAWHAGDGKGNGNMRSIGVEICESGKYSQTLLNASQLVAKLLYERGWGVERLRRHYDWSRKICPRLMYNSGKWTGWEEFKQMVSKQLSFLSQDKQVDIYVNGKSIGKGEIKNGVTNAPVRALCEALGAQVSYKKETKRIDIIK